MRVRPRFFRCQDCQRLHIDNCGITRTTLCACGASLWQQLNRVSAK